MMKRLKQLALLSMIAILSVGCGGDSANEVGQGIKAGNKTQIQRLRNCYLMYMELNDYEGPKDKETLVSFLSTDDTAKMRLERMGITSDDFEAMFTSDRDDEPFKVRWGMSGMGDHAVVFETTGVNGKRLVALGQPQELDAAEYDAYFSGKTKAAGPDTGAPLDADIPDKK